MFLTERVIDQQRKNKIEQNRRAYLRQDPEEDDMGYAYDEHKLSKPLNTQRSVFDNVDDKSINTAPSIFDRTAIFHVGGGEQS